MQTPVSAIKQNISKVLVGQEAVTDLLLTALLAGGHVLVEDVPGMGKTVMARALSRSLSARFGRVQFTPDLLPSDITGLNFFDQQQGRFVFQPGPVFCNILLADEINRATPRTQSSLLECMAEGTVTVDGETRQLPPPFFVIATQNPVETLGTYPLPEAQLDRFLMRISLGYPDRDGEKEILRRGMEGGSREIKAVATAEDLDGLYARFSAVTCAQPVLDYVIDIAAATRRHEQIELGISPRGSLALLDAGRAYALLQGRDYVRPDDIQKLAGPVLLHRLRLKPSAVFKQQTAERVLSDIIHGLRVPGVD